MHIPYAIYMFSWNVTLNHAYAQTPIVSLASTQSILLSHQVYLTDKIDNPKRDRVPHLKCVCFLQPSEESLESLEAELREPKYGEYYLCQWVNLIRSWVISSTKR